MMRTDADSQMSFIDGMTAAELKEHLKFLRSEHMIVLKGRAQIFSTSDAEYFDRIPYMLHLVRGRLDQLRTR
eukprot:4340125-Prymnesium_polylepis.1